MSESEYDVIQAKIEDISMVLYVPYEPDLNCVEHEARLQMNSSTSFTERTVMWIDKALIDQMACAMIEKGHLDFKSFMYASQCFTILEQAKQVIEGMLREGGSSKDIEEVMNRLISAFFYYD